MTSILMVEEFDRKGNIVSENVMQYTNEEFNEMFTTNEKLLLCAGESIAKISMQSKIRWTELVCFYNMRRA